MCGCYYDSKDGIVFCKVHRATTDALNLCRMFRSYFADAMKASGQKPEDSPFVKTVDSMLERHGLGL